MQRAIQTAQIIGQHLGLECVAAEELREIDCGVLEGRNDIEAWRAFQAVIVRWVGGDRDAACDGGETGHQAVERFARFVRDLPDGEGDTLIVGHGGIVAIGLFALCPDLPVKSPRDFYLPNTGMVLVDRTPAGVSCVKWGLSEHLDRPSVADMPDELLR
jgi:probable phosphoglycerate mutase